MVKTEAKPKVIAVLSGGAGAGKSVIVASLAASLSARKPNLRTAIIELDTSLRCLDVILGTQIGESLELHALTDKSELSGLCAKKLTEDDEAHNAYDYVVIDTASSGKFSQLGDVLDVAESADALILVTTPDDDSVRQCAALSDLLYVRGHGAKQRLVINKADTKAEPPPDLDAVTDAVGIPLLGVLPTDSSLKLCTDKGIELPAGSLVANELKAIAARLHGEYVPLIISQKK
ncbi:MAG: AAA family ATPase [Oscillospiraceae bacterium]|nr:AAA family ATPase [Oscillospiraceae bacterium]